MQSINISSGTFKWTITIILLIIPTEIKSTTETETLPERSNQHECHKRQ